MEGFFDLLAQARYWHWLVLGLGLLVAELATGSTYLLWPAVAAWITGVVLLLIPGAPWTMQLLLFAVSAIALTALGHTYLRGRWLTGGGEAEALNSPARRLVGATALAVAPFENGRGRVRLGDSEWPALSDDAIGTGDPVRVTAVEGATLSVTIHRPQDRG